jgi:hypothetical protein
MCKLAEKLFWRLDRHDQKTMAAALPPYDLALDEMSVALSYILLSSGASIPPVAASAVPAQAAAPIAPKKEVPKKVRH